MATRYLPAILCVCGFVIMGRAAPPPPPVAPPAAPTEPMLSDDEKLLKEAKIANDAGALLKYFQKRTLTAKDLDAAVTLLKQLGDDDYFVREKATEELRKRGPSVVPMLRRVVSDPDEEVRDRARTLLLSLEAKTNPALSQAVARALRAKAPPEAMQVLFDFLPTADNEGVEDEVLYTLAALGVKDGKVAKMFDEGLKDKQPNRRAAAALILGRSGTADQKKAVQALLTEADANVRFRAAQGLLAGRDRTAVSALCVLLTDGPMSVGQRAEELLQCLAANQPPRIPQLTDDATLRKRSRQAWEDWWRQNGKMDLAKAEIDLAPFNPALRAREVVRQFGAALLLNDFEGMRKTAGFPFVAYGQQILNTKEEMEAYLQNNNLPDRGFQTTMVITGTVNIETYLQTAQPPEKQFFNGTTGNPAVPPKVKKSEVRAFNVFVAPNPQINPGPGEEWTIFVRTSGDQPKIIGFGAPRGGNMKFVW